MVLSRNGIPILNLLQYTAPYISRTFSGNAQWKPPECTRNRNPNPTRYTPTKQLSHTHPPDPTVVSKWMCGVGFFVKTYFLRSKGVRLVRYRICIRYEAGSIGIRNGQGVRTGRKPRLRYFMLGVRRFRKDTRAFLATK